MTEVVGIKFKNFGKINYFDPDGLSIERETPVIVETVRGLEYGITELSNNEIEDEKVTTPLLKVVRLATEADKKQLEENELKAKEAFQICNDRIKKHNLEMKLIDVEITIDLSKFIFYFTSDGRVDFRELVKDLASIFRTRIELRQIGVRDEAKMLSGIGKCGRTLCCSTFLDEFQPVSIKMAKDQNLSLNPTKISGICGRLMCCLKYEADTYEELTKNLPSEGDKIHTADGDGEVISVSVLRRIVKAAVRKKADEPPVINYYSVDEIKVLTHRQHDKYDRNNNKEEDF